MQMSQLHISLPGFIKPALFKRNSRSAAHPGFVAHFPQTDDAECDQTHMETPVARSSMEAAASRCKPIELRIIQNGEIYRSKAEEARLIALGQWHHRRQRRRRRLTRRV